MAETETAQAVEDQQQTDSKAQAQQAEFSEAEGSESVGAGGSINLLLDMDVSVTVVIGKTQLPIRRILQLGPGSVLRLDKPVEMPVDLYLKDTRFATGDIVVVDGSFAVRIKQFLAAGAANQAQTQ